MHVGIFTYQTGHLKTYQMIQKFLAKSYKITLFAFPFKHRAHQARAFEERPYQIIPLDIKSFCQQAGINFIEISGWDESSALEFNNATERPDYFITVIAKIIPQHFIEGNTIINAHPGLLPENRGVDAFKWSIVNQAPIGVSLHVINRHIDAGRVIKRLEVPVIATDSYEDLCTRAYDMECDLLANFEQYMSEDQACNEVDINSPLSRKSIPENLNNSFNQVFQEYKKQKCL
ncbi:formyl transferase [Pseudoalteromonas sp. S4389]|uniref:formyltransferase family protein n=1 Tax=Pseudoalteromonas sp. S4389 TaxID=579556 RepID=UPI001108136D|nr:formyltransferase family protein [Pseudoalteromonas sp. S4389]TMO44831.1 formyl transferase [Pseudoalteromonas sp. S4389]